MEIVTVVVATIVNADMTVNAKSAKYVNIVNAAQTIVNVMYVAYVTTVAKTYMTSHVLVHMILLATVVRKLARVEICVPTV